MANCGFLTQFLCEFRELITIAQAKFPHATLCISELFVRHSFDVRRYDYELNKLCDVENVKFIRTSTDYKDLSYDGLHLDQIGYLKFATDIYSYLSSLEQKTPMKVSSCMIPLHCIMLRKGQKKKKR